MTADAASWGEIEDFCKKDGWADARTTSHVFYEKALADGTVLRAHISHARAKVPSPGRFRAVLAHELKVSKDEFWECLRTGNQVQRPAPVEEPTFQHPAWVVAHLKSRLHLTDREIDALGPEEAEQMVREAWASQR